MIVCACANVVYCPDVYASVVYCPDVASVVYCPDVYANVVYCLYVYVNVVSVFMKFVR